MIIEIPYAYVDTLTYQAKSLLSLVAHSERLFNGQKLKLVQDDTSPLLSPQAIEDYPTAREILEAQMLRMFDKLPTLPEDVLFLDIESHNSEKRWDMERGEFVRLLQYARGEGEITLTTDINEVYEQVNKAGLVVAHNGHAFDFSVLFGDDALPMAHDGRLFDTWVHASVHFPMPQVYTHANGTTYRDFDTKPANARRWFGLDNQAFQFGFEGKMGNLQELAKRHNPPKTPVSDLDFGLIPLDDPDFLAYAKQDIVVLREYYRSITTVAPVNDYDKRAQFRAAIDAQMSRNGVVLDTELARDRIGLAQRDKEKLLKDLQEKYDFPTEGKMPWRTTAGKSAIMQILSDNGITEETRPDWERTKTGNLSLGGDALIDITKGTPVEALGESLAQLQGQRPLAEQAMNYLAADGRIHPDIDALQRSSRTSVTKPGLTTWGSRTEAGKREKEYFIAAPGHKLIEVDLSNADQRAVAFMSKDKEYAKRFLPGRDGHEITGRLMFGNNEYDTDPAAHREIAKALSHAYAYGAGPKKLAATAWKKLPHLSYPEVLRLANLFVDAMGRAYPQMIRWQNHVRQQGELGWVTNRWGRKMPVQSGRAYTQAPALLGQSSTTELLYDALIELYETEPGYMKYVLFPVHDALVCSPPTYLVDEFTKTLVSCAEQTIEGIEVFVEAGHPADNWAQAMHG